MSSSVPKSKSAAALFQSLEGSKADDIPQKMNGVVEMSSDTTPVDAALELWKHSILGAPVWDDKTKTYIGFFDMRDILSAVIDATRSVHEKKPGGVDIAWTDAMMDSMKELSLKEKQTHKQNVTLAYLARRNPFYSCTATTPLVELCELLSKPRCHRVPICASGDDDPHGVLRCVNMVSRSSLVKFMCEHLAVAEDLQETMEEAGFAYRKNVITIVDSAPAFEAFSLMDSNNLSGLAVVSEDDGTLMGNVSARDIKLAALDEGNASMEMDILSYLAVVRQRQIAKDGKSRYPVSQVREGSTVSHVVNTLVKTGYHRVFVADSNNRPVGVVSVSDVLRFVLQ